MAEGGVTMYSEQKRKARISRRATIIRTHERGRRVSANDTVSVDRLPALAESVVAAYFSKNEEPLFAVVVDDCTLISDKGTAIQGIEQLRSIMRKRANAPSMMVRETDFRLVSAQEEPHVGSNAVVTGSYKLYSSPREQLLYAATQFVTMCFTLTDEGWRAFHMHTSLKPSDSVEEDIFPIKASRETYEYVREILRTGSKAGILPSRIMLENNESSRYVNPDDILFVEAEGKRSIVHCLHTTFPVSSLISEVIPQLPGTFLRVHRSYLVNTAHISGMRKYTLQLSDGSEIPIPERRYAEVRREIALRATGGLG